MGYDVDRKPATYARAQARLYTRDLVFLLAAAIPLVALTVFAGFTLKSNLVAVVALAALIAVKRAFDRRESLARRWAIGARAESAVGEVLNHLRDRGFTVMHDIAQRREGNIDHLVKGPTGVYLIETKSGRYQLADLKKAKRQAAKVARELGVWVTPVICRPGSKVFRHDGVFVVPRQLLLGWIERGPSRTSRVTATGSAARPSARPAR